MFVCNSSYSTQVNVDWAEIHSLEYVECLPSVFV